MRLAALAAEIADVSGHLDQLVAEREQLREVIGDAPRVLVTR